MKYTLTFLMLFLLGSACQSIAAPNEKIDYLQLGATLLKDGYVKRAQDVLDKVDVEKDEFDFVTYYTLKGVMLHKLGYPVLSNIFFEESIKQGQTKTSIYLYVARNYWQKRDYQNVINALDNAGDSAKENQQMYSIKAEAFKQLKQHDNAWKVLDEGIERFPEYAKFYSQKFYYLMELGFFQYAEKYAKEYLRVQSYSAKDYLALAFALRENHQYLSAAALLEEAAIKHPGDEKLLELLGQVYIDQAQYLMAALVYDWASIKFPKFANKASVLYLKADEPIRSLQLNRRMIDQGEKFKQRLGIDIYLEDYESLVAKEDALKRYNLLKEENITYALGYAYFRVGEYEKSKHYLKQLTDNQLFAKSSYLFQKIEKCQNEPIECR